MKPLTYFPVAFVLVIMTGLVLGSCTSDSGGGGGKLPPADEEITVSGISDSQWTYISLETNSVMGTSPYGDIDADVQWADRTDWDLAICGDKIRTNSGTSGKGQGGLRRIDDRPYEEVSATDATAFEEDRPQAPDASRK